MTSEQIDAAKLSALVIKILNQHSTDFELTEALDEFLLICSHASDILPSLSFSALAGDTELQQGVAINPEAAAQCVKDYPRTVAFIRSLYAAIQDTLEAQPNKTLKLLYAGCGPYATILLPLLSIIDSAQLDLHLLDIHEESLLSVQQLVGHFQFDKFTISYHCENACEFEPPTRFDIIVVETMQKALEQEPQVMVTSNLASLLNPNGIFLPEQIKVDLCLRDKNTQSVNVCISNIFTLTASFECSQDVQNALLQDDPKIQLGTVVIPAFYNSQSHELVLSTNIKIYNGIWLTDNDSEITLVTLVYDLQEAIAGEQWRASYHLGSYPRFGFAV